MSPVDQAKEAAEECPNQGEDDEFGEEFEYEHPPLSPWRLLLVQLRQQTGQKFSESRRAVAVN